MKICLYTMQGHELSEMGKITAPNKLEYCNRHGYTFHQEPFTNCMWQGFERLPHLAEMLYAGLFDWIYCLGCDALITNLNIRLETLINPAFGIIMATDAMMIQSDSFLIQNAHNSLALLDKAWEHRGAPIGKASEQSTIQGLMSNPFYSNTVKLVPQRTLNSYEYSLYNDMGPPYTSHRDRFGNDGQWQRGDFVLHVPGRPLDTKIRTLASHVPSIVR